MGDILGTIKRMATDDPERRWTGDVVLMLIAEIEKHEASHSASVAGPEDGPTRKDGRPGSSNQEESVVSGSSGPDGEKCHDCGERYSEVWWAPADIWKEVTGREHSSGGLFCITCFTLRAAEKGWLLRWRPEYMMGRSEPTDYAGYCPPDVPTEGDTPSKYADGFCRVCGHPADMHHPTGSCYTPACELCATADDAPTDLDPTTHIPATCANCGAPGVNRFSPSSADWFFERTADGASADHEARWLIRTAWNFDYPTDGHNLPDAWYEAAKLWLAATGDTA